MYKYLIDFGVDFSMFSRQRYVLGDSAMKRMAQSSVLICGLGGLGVEIGEWILSLVQDSTQDKSLSPHLCLYSSKIV